MCTLHFLRNHIQRYQITMLELNTSIFYVSSRHVYVFTLLTGVICPSKQSWRKKFLEQPWSHCWLIPCHKTLLLRLLRSVKNRLENQAKLQFLSLLVRRLN